MIYLIKGFNGPIPALREFSAALATCASSIFAAFAAISTSVQQWRIESEASRNSLSKELKTFPGRLSSELHITCRRVTHVRKTGCGSG